MFSITDIQNQMQNKTIVPEISLAYDFVDGRRLGKRLKRRYKYINLILTK